MPALQLAVTLRVVWASSNMCQTILANECLEIIGDELRAIVAAANIPRSNRNAYYLLLIMLVEH